MAGLKLEADVSNVVSGINKIAGVLDKAGIKADTFVRDLRGIPEALKGLAALQGGVKLAGNFANLSEAVKASRSQIQTAQSDMTKYVESISSAMGKLKASVEGMGQAKGFDMSALSSLSAKLNVQAPGTAKGIPNIKELSKSKSLTSGPQKLIAEGANEIIKTLDSTIKDYMEMAENAIKASSSKFTMSSMLQGGKFTPVQHVRPAPYAPRTAAQIKADEVNEASRQLDALYAQLMTEEKALEKERTQVHSVSNGAKVSLTTVNPGDTAGLDNRVKDVQTKLSFLEKIKAKFSKKEQSQELSVAERMQNELEDAAFMKDPQSRIAFYPPHFNRTGRFAYHLKGNEKFFDPSVMDIYGVNDSSGELSRQANSLREMALNKDNIVSDRMSVNDLMQQIVVNIAGIFARNTDANLGPALKSAAVLPPHSELTGRQEIADTVFKVVDRYFEQALEKTASANGIDDMRTVGFVKDSLDGANSYVDKIKTFGFLNYDPDYEKKIRENERLYIEGKDHKNEDEINFEAMTEALRKYNADYDAKRQAQIPSVPQPQTVPQPQMSQNERLRLMFNDAFDLLSERVIRLKEDIKNGLGTDSASKGIFDTRMAFGMKVNELAKLNGANPEDIDRVLHMGDLGVSKVTRLLAERGPGNAELKNIGEVSAGLKGSAEDEVRSIMDFVQSTTKAFVEYRRLLEQNSQVEGGKVLSREEMESSRSLYAGMRDLSKILPGAGFSSKVLANSLDPLRESVWAEGQAAGTTDKKNVYVPRNPDKDRGNELKAQADRLEAALKDPRLSKDLKETFDKILQDFKTVLAEPIQKAAGGKKSRGGPSAERTTGSYRNSKEYLTERLEVERSRAGTYAEAVDTGRRRTALKERSEPLDLALKRARLERMSGGLGGGGFLSGFGGSIAQNLMSGYGGLNFSWAFRRGIAEAAKTDATDSLIAGQAFRNGGMRELFLTDTAFNEESFRQNLKGLDGFKNFVAKVNETLGKTGKSMSEEDVLSQLKSGKMSREELLRGLTSEERQSLAGSLSGDKRTRRRVVRGLRTNANDRALMASGLSGSSVAAGTAMMAASVILPVMAVTKLAKAIKNLAASSVKAFENIEKLQTQMSVVFSTDSQASEMFGNVKEYAKATPFGVEQTTQQAILLRQSGVYASDLMDTIKRLGDMSSGNADKLKTLTDVYARVTSSMTVTARDLRQLSNAGVASYKALSDATGIQQSQIRSRLQTGKITATDFQKMVKNLTDEGGTFYGATERGAKTLAGRKQRLSDTFTLTKAEYGELLAKLGGTDTTNSLLGKIMSIAEDILNDMGKTAERTNDNKTMNAADAAMKSYQKNKKLYEEALAGGDKDIIKARKENMDKSYEEWEKTRAGQESVAVARWEEAKKVIDQIKQGKIDGHDIVGAASGRNAVEGMVWNTDSKGVMDAQELNDFIDNFMGSIDFSSGDVIDQIRKKAKGLTVQYIDGISKYLDSEGNVYEAIQTKTVNIEDVLVDNFQNMLAGVANEVDKAGKAANDVLDGIIRAADVKIDDVEDISRKLNEMTASQSRMSNARTDWNQNSSVAQMMLRDANAARDENLKRRIMYYEDERGILDKDTGKYNLGRLNLNEFKEAEDLITADSSEMNLNIGALWDAATDSMIEGADETLKKYAENISEVMDSVMQSGGEDLLGSEGYDTFVNLFGALKRASSDINKDNITSVIMLMDQVDKMADNLAASNSQFGEAFKTSVQRAKLDKTRDTENKKYINKRKQADLWAQIISQTTGISAERVQLSGARASMAAYTSNFARRDMFSTLGKSLMQNGVSLKELSDVIKDNKKGGGYDWIGASNGIEAMAARKSVETQDALINAYQQQIDTLNNLEMAGVATRDQWDNLGSLSAQLGVGFSLAAEEMADGSYRFTEATIQAAEDMKRELNLKKFIQQIDNVFNRKITELNKSTMETRVKAAFVGNGIDFGKGFNTQDRLSMAEVFVQPVEFLLNQSVETFADALASTASDMDTKAVLKDLLGMELDSLEKKIIPVTKKRDDIPHDAGISPNQYLGNDYRPAFINAQNELFEKYGKMAMKPVSGDYGDPTLVRGSKSNFTDSTDFFYEWKGNSYKTGGGIQTLAKLLSNNKEAFEELSKYLDATTFTPEKGRAYKYSPQRLKNSAGVLPEEELVKEFNKMGQEAYEGVVYALARFVHADELEKDLLDMVNKNKEKFGLSDKDTNIRLDNNMGVTKGSKETVPYGILFDQWHEKYTEEGGEYIVNEAVVSDEVKEVYDTLVNKFKTEDYTDDDLNNLLKLSQLIYPKLMDSTKDLALALERNTVATNQLAAAQETSAGLDKIQEFYKMTGRLGIGEREAFGKGHRASYDAKAYGDMEEYAPGRMHINTFAQDRMLEWLGLPSDADFKGMLDRYIEGFVPQRIKDGSWGNLDDIYEQKRLGLEESLGLGTEEYEKAFKNLMSEKAKDELAGSNFTTQIGAYLANNERRFERQAAWGEEGRDLRWSKEGRVKFRSDMDDVKKLLTPDALTGEVTEENLKNATDLLSNYGITLDDIVKKWALAGAAERDAALALKEMGQNLKNAFKDAGINAYLDTTKLIGENMYKIENSLMTQKEAEESIKKSLAGQAAALLDNISKVAVETGLRLIGAGAMEHDVGIMAAGIGLAAAGGFGSVASGLLSGYANDSSKNKTEEQIARLESLRDNLANLLKQAKDDAEYYETNLRAKEAFQANESISATKVTKTNDMILSPQGVFSTHPDDYIMAMKDPASLKSTGGASPINLTIVNESGVPLSVTRTESRERDDGSVDLQVMINSVVQSSMIRGDYDKTFAAMQQMQQGASVSA